MKIMKNVPCLYYQIGWKVIINRNNYQSWGESLSSRTLSAPVILHPTITDCSKYEPAMLSGFLWSQMQQVIIQEILWILIHFIRNRSQPRFIQIISYQAILQLVHNETSFVEATPQIFLPSYPVYYNTAIECLHCTDGHYWVPSVPIHYV